MSTSDCSISCQFEDAESKMNLDVLISPDDVAWADSCLTFEPEINMDSLKEALLDFVSYHSEPLETSKDKRQASNDEITPSTEEMDISTNFEVHVESVPFTDTTENMDEDDPLKEETDAPTSTDYLAKAFLPTFKDEMIEIQYFPDSDADLDFPEFAWDWESLYEGIFKVWDLCLPVEEDLRMGRLSKTLGDESLKKVVSTFDGSEAGKGINDLIAGIADMSLQRRFGRKYHVRK